MAFANVTVTVTEPNVAVSSDNVNVSVSQTTSNVTVSSSAVLSNADIRAALGNTFPILYDTSTGVISIDGSAISGGNVVASGNQSGNITLDKNDGAFFTVTPTADITGITLNNFNAGETMTIVFEQNSIGGSQIDTTTHASNWTAWNFAAGSTSIDENANNWSTMSIFGLGTSGSAATEYYASIVREEANDTITNLTVTNNVSAGGNVVGTYLHGDGSNVTGVSTLTNAQVITHIEGGSYGNLDVSTNISATNFTTAGFMKADSFSAVVGDATFTGNFSGDGSSITGLTTSIVSEGSNQYFTTDRANTAIGAYTGALTNLTGNITTTGILTAGTNATDVHSLTGNLNVTGNVEVSGNLNYRNVEDLYVRDQSITLNANAATDATSSIIINRPVAGSNTVLRWNETDDKWQFSNDGSTYQDLIGLTNLSVTTAAASGGGALSYSNTTGVFTFTPADLSAGVSNAQAKAFIEANGLDMTANITSTALISTSANIDSTASLNFTADTSDLSIITVQADTPSDSTTILDVTSARSADGGPQNIYRKATGTIASPGAIGTRDYVYRNRFFGHDGTDYQETFGAMVYQDNNVGGVSANIVPLAYEFYTHNEGNVNAGFIQSLIRMDSQRNIIFNDDGTRTFGSGQGNANITQDGTINTVSGINATGNISGGNVIATTGLHGAFLNIPDTNLGTSSIANVEFGASNTITIANNGSLVFSDNNGVLTGVNLFNASSEINVLLGNVYASRNLAINGFSGGIGLVKYNDTANAAYGYGISLGDPNPQAVFSIEQDSSSATKYDNWKKYGGLGAVARDTLHINNHYYRANGTVASPGVIRNGGLITEDNYHAYDGTQFYKGARNYVIHDDTAGAPATNAVNLSYEFTSIPSVNNEHSRLAICANGAIQFNANTTLQDASTGLGRNDGNASIALDGTINSVANITATGNVSGAYILGNGSQLTGITGSGITNAQAQSFIQTNGLSMTANIDTTASLNFTADTSDLALITAVADTPSDGTTVLDITSARTGDGGPQTFYSKATGSIASPGAISTRDYVYRERYKGHDGTDYQETMGYMVYQDSDVGGVSANVVPLAFEFYTDQGGDVNHGFIQSLIRMDSDRNIIFNDTGTRTFGNGQGNANITMDGTINTVSDVNATGNITATANINAGGGTLTGVTTSNSNIETSAFFVGDLDGAVVQDVRNETGSTLSKGKAVYLTGTSTGDNPHVALADADDSSKMPALGIVYSDIANASVGQVVTSGVINVASHGFTEGADLFVSTTAGDLTTTAPTGESAGLQKIGKVVSANHILVQGAFRQNATPNLDNNNIFIGNSANRATTVSLEGLTSNVETTARITSLNLNSGANTLPISILYGSGSVGVDYIQMNTSIDPKWIDSTPVTIGDSDSTNPFANGSVSADNTYFVARHSSIAGLYVLYADAGMTTLSASGATTINPTTANVTFNTFNVTSNHAVNGYPYGAVYSKTFESGSDVKAANAIFTDNIFSYTSGARFSLTSVSVTDLTVTDPLGINSVANSSLSGGSYANPFKGAIVYVTGDRNGSDGAPAYWNGTVWKYFSDDANVTYS